MSILIKGMEMPRSCMLCSFCVEEADPANGEMCMVTGKLMPPCTRVRLDDCPLIELPPHGRLIDADAFEKPFVEQIKSYDEWISKMLDMEDYGATNLILKAERDRAILATLVTKVKDTPTVIEAEEGGEQNSET